MMEKLVSKNTHHLFIGLRTYVISKITFGFHLFLNLSFWDLMLAASNPISTPVGSRQCPNFLLIFLTSQYMMHFLQFILISFNYIFHFCVAVYVSAGFNKRLKLKLKNKINVNCGPL